jgi:hypothetical protein
VQLTGASVAELPLAPAAERDMVRLAPMTKAFRVEEQVKQLSAALRARSYGPPSFYTYLETKGIDWRRSVLLDSVQEQGRCLCGKLIDHRRRLFEFDLDFAGYGVDPTQWERSTRSARGTSATYR